MRLQPIKVFCFHQVSDELDLTKCFECDWTETKQFKETVLELNQRYKFISLQEAYEHLRHDKIRFGKYAVLTSDDGYHSLLPILQWLNVKGIPITLFVNVQYLDGKHYLESLYRQALKVAPELKESDFVRGLYMTKEEIEQLDSQWVSIGLHGFEHVSVMGMDERVFEIQLEKCLSCIGNLKGFVPFYAYTFGRHTTGTDSILRSKGLVPVLMDESYNVNDVSFIHRECIDKGLG